MANDPVLSRPQIVAELRECLTRYGHCTWAVMEVSHLRAIAQALQEDEHEVTYAHKRLDDEGVPRHDGAGELSLGGRINELYGLFNADKEKALRLAEPSDAAIVPRLPLDDEELQALATAARQFDRGYYWR